MSKSVAKIFEIRPEQWGLRGDPYLWDDLEKVFTNISMPLSQDEFQKAFLSSFENLTGIKLGEKENVFISKYSHGGMSSGYISMNFWVKKAIPLLIKRLEILNQENGK